MHLRIVSESLLLFSVIFDIVTDIIKHDKKLVKETIYPMNVEYTKKSEFEGIAEAKIFEDFLGKHQKDTILLIGDGNYSDDVKRVVKSVDNKLIYLMLGCECNRSRLIKLVSVDNLYETADIVTCIDDFMRKT